MFEIQAEVHAYGPSFEGIDGLVFGFRRTREGDTWVVRCGAHDTFELEEGGAITRIVHNGVEQSPDLLPVPLRTLLPLADVDAHFYSVDPDRTPVPVEREDGLLEYRAKSVDRSVLVIADPRGFVVAKRVSVLVPEGRVDAGITLHPRPGSTLREGPPLPVEIDWP